MRPLSSPRRIASVAALVLMLAAAISLLVGPAQARSAAKPARGAATHSVCHHVAHPKRGARACTQSRRRVKARAHRRAGVRHATIALPIPGAPAAPSAPSAPGCENGSAALRLRDGTLGCADGSEPACEDGASPALSPSGSIVSCTAPSEDEAAGCEYASGCSTNELPNPGCEDGSAPVHAADGSFACEDASRPACSDGSTPMRSPAGTALVCLVPPGTETEA
jgi:hypothetical protein